MNFRQRLNQSELMDEHNLGSETLQLVLKDINRSNNLLGGHTISMRSISSLQKKNGSDLFSVLDVGCGDGILLRLIADSLRRKGIKAELYGVDNSKETIELARKQSHAYPEITYFCEDFLNSDVQLPVCNIVISTLTMHHFNNAKLPQYLNNCKELAKNAIVINDLHRSELAYYLFKIFSFIFIRSSIAKHDGLLSIRKGFKKSELSELASFLPEWKHVIKWKWAFRYVWVMEPNRPIN